MSLSRSINDFKRFTTGGGFQVSLKFTSPVNFTAIDSVHFALLSSELISLNGALLSTFGEEIKSIVVNGLESTHHTGISTDGLLVHTKNARITFIEADLVALNYPVRNAKGEVSLMDHYVEYTDKFGILRQMRIKEVLPDQTIGIITAWLGDIKHGSN